MLGPDILERGFCPLHFFVFNYKNKECLMFSKPRMDAALVAAMASSFSNAPITAKRCSSGRARLEDEAARNKRIKGRKRAKVARQQRRRNRKSD
ncbi:MAG: hypothetical protein CMF37_15020 [Leeuwenhoekiella sp.]|nr:hypothetical protein [Leeuwenhoekiella sp.]MBQ50074.1 hypothetical protein [Leeuwenhoekiella sp.]MBQ50271.1 hypothetical protein [Leeuwenhoekiella sp.]MBQ50468.1 hypothetical protein [Leeuwenhoekiella sp.]